jgi:hypothetical protein
MSDADCPSPALDAACKLCPDGSPSCPGGLCLDGQCQIGYPPCPMPPRPPPNACASDKDCPGVGAPCHMCANGTTNCPVSSCLKGQCQVSWTGC